MLNKSILAIVSKYEYLHSTIHSKDTLGKCKTLLGEIHNIEKELSNSLKSIVSVKTQTSKFITEIENDLLVKRKKENFIFNTVDGMLSYLGRDFIKVSSKSTGKPQDKSTGKPQDKSTGKPLLLNPTTVKKIQLTTTNYITLPSFPKDKNCNLPPIFYHLQNDFTSDQHINDQPIQNIYCCLVDKVIVQVPFPQVLNSTKIENKNCSIKCKFKSIKKCNDNKEKLEKIYNTPVKKCSFAHEGESINKIGYPSRCTMVPDIGNLSSLENDLDKVDIDSIRSLLLYGVHDIFIAMLWFKKNNIKECCIEDLAIA